MLTTLTIVSLNQGSLNTALRAIGQYDAHLLEDIGYGSAHAESQMRRRARTFFRWLRPSSTGRSK